MRLVSDENGNKLLVHSVSFQLIFFFFMMNKAAFTILSV